ncbi:MAG: 2-amino-4-hydroxy-6-hydroxymethyldihydropteridine diphosphokinase [Deltaproteobacteria bacterium]|nr:2-amino-4-hydroxy-6-hydroxymethyldihydropteridine diphosphokinase [Deltaproteobacteria bacterium]
MPTTYIGIGSNLGDRVRNCSHALGLLGRIADCRLIRWSQWFFTEPVGVRDQGWYLNGVACVKTEIGGRELLTHLLEIETAMKRVRTAKWGPRIIDLDLLLYGQEIIDREEFKVPHPLMHTRRFVLVPMVQLAPKLIHPALGRTMKDLLDGLQEDGQKVIPYEAVGGLCDF